MNVVKDVIYKGYGLKHLSKDGIDKIHQSTLKILENIGIKVEEKKALRTFKENGCIVDSKGVVKIPPSLVEESLKKAPHKIEMYGRDGKKRMTLEGRNVYFGTAGGSPYIRTIDGERKQANTEDIEDSIRVADGLEYVDFVMAHAVPWDKPAMLRDLYEFLFQIKNSVKPSVPMAYEAKHGALIAEMGAKVMGGMDELRKKPIMILYTEPVTPLILRDASTRNFLDFVERGLPTVFAPTPIGGITTPITLAGLVTINNTECLSELVLGQLTNPGAPMVYGGGTGVMDPRLGSYSFGAPEQPLTGSINGQLAQHYNLPSWGHCGASDSKTVDGQAYWESLFSMMTTAFSGQNLNHDLGFLECAITYSVEMLVATNEMAGLIKRFLRGLEVSDETIAYDVIEKVGIGGSFLAEAHTRKHIRNEVFMPELADRESYESWVKKGCKDTIMKSREKGKKIQAQHYPEPLDKDMLNELDRIIAKGA